MPTTTTVPRMSGPPRPQQCGRCRRFFPRASAPELSDELIWWACPPCHAKLFTATATVTATAATVGAGPAPGTGGA